MTRLVALTALLLTTASAIAADNAVIITVGSGVTMRSKDVGSLVQSMIEIPGDTSGNPLATAPGTPNSVFALPVQGVTSGTPIAVSISGAQSTNITQWNTVSLGSPTAWGTAPSGNVVGMNGNILVSVPEGTLGSAAGCSPGSNNTLIQCAYQAHLDIISAPTLGSASGGWSPKLLNALSTTVTTIKASAAGQLGMLQCGNTNASEQYVQIFDVATSGGVTLGTTVPKLSIPIPATNSDGFTLSLVGFQFASGIQIAATTTATGSTAPGTALDCNAGFN